MPLAADRILVLWATWGYRLLVAELFRTREEVSDPFLILLGLAMHN
jgi:hypothetical protein